MNAVGYKKILLFLLVLLCISGCSNNGNNNNNNNNNNNSSTAITHEKTFTNNSKTSDAKSNSGVLNKESTSQENTLVFTNNINDEIVTREIEFDSEGKISINRYLSSINGEYYKYIGIEDRDGNDILLFSKNNNYYITKDIIREHGNEYFFTYEPYEKKISYRIEIIDDPNRPYDIILPEEEIIIENYNPSVYTAGEGIVLKNPPDTKYYKFKEFRIYGGNDCQTITGLDNSVFNGPYGEHLNISAIYEPNYVVIYYDIYDSDYLINDNPKVLNINELPYTLKDLKRNPNVANSEYVNIGSWIVEVAERVEETSVYFSVSKNTNTITKDDIYVFDNQKCISVYAETNEVYYNIEYTNYPSWATNNSDSYSPVRGYTFDAPHDYYSDKTFLYWQDENGNKITNIPVGSTGDRVITAKFKDNSTNSGNDHYLDPFDPRLKPGSSGGNSGSGGSSGDNSGNDKPNTNNIETGSGSITHNGGGMEISYSYTFDKSTKILDVIVTHKNLAFESPCPSACFVYYNGGQALSEVNDVAYGESKSTYHSFALDSYTTGVRIE